MLLGGLWHGANWTFLLWGGWHGLLLSLERLLGYAPEGKEPFSRVFTTFITLLAVMLGWVLFRAPDIGSALVFYKGMAGMNAAPVGTALTWDIKSVSLLALAIGCIIVFVQPYFAKYRTPVQLSEGSVAIKSAMPVHMQLLAICAFLMAVSRLLAMSYSPFLYFQF
jgi:alginate O-acetyltransferase complex protein AlgI